MGRKATGTVRVLLGEDNKPAWHARWTRADGTRNKKWRPLPGRIPVERCCYVTEPACSHRTEAKACAARMAPRILTASANGGAGDTVEDYADQWLKTRPTRAQRDGQSHLEHHVLPTLRDLRMRDVTSAHGDTIVAALDSKIAAGTLSDKSARNIWGTARKMMKDAANAKPATGLRCIDVNPFRDVAPPERSRVKKAKQFLYPSELLALLRHPDVPRHWKRNAAVATYLGLRDGEQRALRWQHVDLEHGTVYVCETFDRDAKKARVGTKTEAPRTVPIPAPLMPLLEQMNTEADGTGLVCRKVASQRAMARGLRTWLRKAGVNRASLFADTAVNLNLRWHDLRATCGTWLAVQGRSATEIRDVLGHTQTSMTDRYMRNATAVRSGAFGEVFPTLPDLLGIAPNRPGAIGGSRSSLKQAVFSGVDGTRTRGLRRDRPAL